MCIREIDYYCLVPIPSLQETRTNYPSRAHRFNRGFIVESVLLIFLIRLSSFCVFCPMLYMSLECPLLIVPSVFSDVYLLYMLNHLELYAMAE